MVTLWTYFILETYCIISAQQLEMPDDHENGSAVVTKITYITTRGKLLSMTITIRRQLLVFNREHGFFARSTGKFSGTNGTSEKVVPLSGFVSIYFSFLLVLTSSLYICH